MVRLVRHVVRPPLLPLQVAQHNTVDDCWLAAHGRVYAIPTDFILNGHPGSSRSIMRHAGQECTVDFDFHSCSARKEWEKYIVGTVKPCGPPQSSCCVQ